MIAFRFHGVRLVGVGSGRAAAVLYLRRDRACRTQRAIAAAATLAACATSATSAASLARQPDGRWLIDNYGQG